MAMYDLRFRSNCEAIKPLNKKLTEEKETHLSVRDVAKSHIGEFPDQSQVSCRCAPVKQFQRLVRSGQRAAEIRFNVLGNGVAKARINFRLLYESNVA